MSSEASATVGNAMIGADPRRVYDVEVVSVTDGDDLVVQVNEPGWPEIDGAYWRVRVWGIDAPEWNQPYGREAKMYLERLCSSGFSLEVIERDVYNRYVGVLRLRSVSRVASGRDTVNRRMVLSGLAYWYRHYAGEETIGLRAAEQEAKQAQRGVWSKPDGGTRPWELRAQRRTAGEPERVDSTDAHQRVPGAQSSERTAADSELLEKLRELEVHLQKLQETDVLLVEWLQERDHQDRQEDFRKLREELQAQHLSALQQAREQLEQQHTTALQELSNSMHRSHRAAIEELRMQLIAQSDVRLGHATAEQPRPRRLWARLRRALFR